MPAEEGVNEVRKDNFGARRWRRHSTVRIVVVSSIICCGQQPTPVLLLTAAASAVPRGRNKEFAGLSQVFVENNVPICKRNVPFELVKHRPLDGDEGGEGEEARPLGARDERRREEVLVGGGTTGSAANGR